MTAPDSADTVIEQAAQIILRHFNPSPYGGSWRLNPSEAARALHAAGLLADPADRDDYGCSYTSSTADYCHQHGSHRADAEGHCEVATAIARADRLAETVAKFTPCTCSAQRSRAERAEAEVARLTARLGDCHCDLNPETTDGPHEDCPQHGRSYAKWVEATDAKGAEAADLREWRRKILDVMGYDDTPEYAEELLTYLPAWKAEGEADREHITELRATVERVRALVDGWAGERYDPSSVTNRYIRGRDDQLTDCTLKLGSALDGAGGQHE